MNDAPRESALGGEDGPTALQTVVWLVRRLLVGGITLFAAYAGLRACSPPQWAFSVEASTEVAEIELPASAETRWRVDGAVLCSRGELSADPARLAPGPATACGGRAWRAYRLGVSEPVVVLEGRVRALLQILEDGSAALALRNLEGAPTVGRLTLAGIPDLPLPSPIHLIWEPAAGLDGASPGPRLPDLVLPFTGSTTLGRDIHWSSAGMLQNGRITVFTSDESADRRHAVDEVTLMLGDQVRLRPASEAPGGSPKGFARVPLGERRSIEVVAFGRADRVRIERFGDNGFDFAPGRVARVLNDPALIGWGSVLLGILGVVASAQGLLGEGSRWSSATVFRLVRRRLRTRLRWLLDREI